MAQAYKSRVQSETKQAHINGTTQHILCGIAIAAVGETTVDVAGGRNVHALFGPEVSPRLRGQIY